MQHVLKHSGQQKLTTIQSAFGGSGKKQSYSSYFKELSYHLPDGQTPDSSRHIPSMKQGW
jgi:hypothetical protein